MMMNLDHFETPESTQHTESSPSSGSAVTDTTKHYVLDTNVLIHDPNAVYAFEEHVIVIPIVVLEELDKLKTGNNSTAADCRQAIRVINAILGNASPEAINDGVPIYRPALDANLGRITILMPHDPAEYAPLDEHHNDNRIINAIHAFGQQRALRPVLVSKDINMRLKARACGIDAEDYQNDQLLDDIALLPRGYREFKGSFWEQVSKVETRQDSTGIYHRIEEGPSLPDLRPNEYLLDDIDFIGQVCATDDKGIILRDLSRARLMDREAWGLFPRDRYQALALDLLMNEDIHLVSLTGAAGSGKTILALAAAIELTVASKRYKRIIVTRSTRGLDEDIGFLPGTEAEKMEPWLGAITDNLEALHDGDESMTASVDYILQKVPIQFKSLNYIRGRSFQHSLIIIDESQNLTPHQIKTIITRAGTRSKVICLGNLAQIDTPYLNPLSSGLTYLTERFKGFQHGGHIHLQGVPRSVLAEYAETHL